MVTWLGALSRGGVIFGVDEERGVDLAVRILGEDRLVSLRERFAALSPERRARERVGAIHACVWIAHADRRLAEEEVALLRRIVHHADLSAEQQRALLDAIDSPTPPAVFAEELTDAALRELTLGLAWQLAWADGRLDDEERRAHHDLAESFGVDAATEAAIRQAVVSAAS